MIIVFIDVLVGFIVILRIARLSQPTALLRITVSVLAALYVLPFQV